MSAAPSAAPAPLGGDGVWIQSPTWDAFWMFGGLWGVALMAAGAGLPWLAPVTALLVAAQHGLAVAHAWSTTWMVLGSSLLRDARRADPMRFVWRPLAIALLALGLGVAVATTQRFPGDGSLGPGLWIWALYIGLYWVGHFWHFGNQDFGVLTLYRTRAGQDHWLDRRVDKLFTAILMFGVQPVLFVVLLGTTPFSELVWALLPVPAASLEWASHVAVGVAVVLFAGYVVFELRKPNRSLPKLLYAVVIVLHPTLLYAAVRSGEVLLGVLYVVAYLWSHWLIAVGLVARINTRLYRSRGEPARAAWLRHAAIVLGIAGLVLVVTAPYLDYLLFDTSDHAYKARLAEIASGREWLLGLVMGFFLAEQLVHYYCDRCLFRFRNPAVRARVAPLLLGAPSPDGA